MSDGEPHPAPPAPRLAERDYTYFTTARGFCRGCRKVVPARVMFRGNQVWQESLCPTCQNKPALIAADKEWYLAHVLKEHLDRAPLKCSQPSRKGCPYDCGPCAWHASPCQLPVVSVTNACELRCPICFTYNRPDQLYFMEPDEFGRIVDWIVESSGPVDLINVTGGEPTLHPRLLELLARARRPEIGRITVNSNGLRLAEDMDLCRQLADQGVSVILSFNTFDSATSVRMHGRDLVETKLRAIENLRRAGAFMTLLTVACRGVNEHELGNLFDLAMDSVHILSFTIQTMTYTGQGGGRFQRAAHLPVDETTRLLCDQSNGRLRFDDFLSRPSAHPLCYLTCCAIRAGDEFLPFARLLPHHELLELTKDSYLPRVGDADTFFRDLLNRLYAQNRIDETKALRRVIEEVFPPGVQLEDSERRRRAASLVRTVYIHAHMDEDTFDASRAMLCPDMVPVEPGRLVPACTYNLFYRPQDPRFYVES